MPPRTQAEVTTSLTTLAFMNGNYSAAVRELKANGVSVKPETLKNWATNVHIEEYERIKNNLKETYEEETVNRLKKRIEEADKAEQRAIQRALDTIHATDDPKSAAQTAYYLNQSKKNNIEKMRLMMEKPTEIIEDRTPEAVLRALVQRGILKPVGNNGHG